MPINKSIQDVNMLESFGVVTRIVKLDMSTFTGSSA